jgi:hypothetical protein
VLRREGKKKRTQYGLKVELGKRRADVTFGIENVVIETDDIRRRKQKEIVFEPVK